MPSTYNDLTGSNTRKTLPTSNLGTRELVFLSIGMNWNLYQDTDIQYPNDGTDFVPHYEESNTIYSGVVRAIQQVTELYYLGAPDPVIANYGFSFAIATDTAEWRQSQAGNYPVTDNRLINDVIDAVNMYLLDTPVGTSWGLTLMTDTGFGFFPTAQLY